MFPKNKTLEMPKTQAPSHNKITQPRLPPVFSIPNRKKTLPAFPPFSEPPPATPEKPGENCVSIQNK